LKIGPTEIGPTEIGYMFTSGSLLIQRIDSF